MRHLIFDITTYNQTNSLGRLPIYRMVEEDFGEIEATADEVGVPTRGAIIGYRLAGGLLATLVIYIFVAL